MFRELPTITVSRKVKLTMAINSRAPAFVLLKYTANNHAHVMSFCISPDTIGVGVNTIVNTKFGSTSALSDSLTEDLIPVLVPFFRGADSFDEAEVYSQPTPDDDPLYCETIPIAMVGTNAGTTTPFGQGVLSLRTAAGGIGKVYLMEGVLGSNIHDPRPFTDPRVTDLANYLTGPGSIWYARDNSFPILGLTWNTKTNDALRKKYLLNV